jgi:transposase
MKSKDLQKLGLAKYENGDGPSKIFNDMKGVVEFRTINLWCKMIRETGSLQLIGPSGGPRLVRTKANIQKVKNRLKRKKGISSRKLSGEFNISRTSIQRILRNDLGLRAYKKIIEQLEQS